eukprot:6187172-Pleurochrysis_carterae.AAC.2
MTQRCGHVVNWLAKSSPWILPHVCLQARAISMLRKWNKNGNDVTTRSQMQMLAAVLNLDADDKAMDTLFDSLRAKGSESLLIKKVEDSLNEIRCSSVRLDPSSSMNTPGSLTNTVDIQPQSNQSDTLGLPTAGPMDMAILQQGMQESGYAPRRQMPFTEQTAHANAMAHRHGSELRINDSVPLVDALKKARRTYQRLFLFRRTQNSQAILPDFIE